MKNIACCLIELNDFIKTKKWYSNNTFQPFYCYVFANIKDTIIFDRHCAERKYLELQQKKLASEFLNKINNDKTRKEIKEHLKRYNKKLDRYMIEIIDPILKKYDINNIVFKNVFETIEYVRIAKEDNEWFDKVPDYIYQQNNIMT